MKLGIVLPNWIGDAVMAGPALRAMRKHFGPDATLIGIMRPYVADVLAGTPWLDEQFFYAPRSADHELRTLSLVRRMRQRRLDAVVLLTNSIRSGLLAYASGARQRVGYARYGRGALLTNKLTPITENGKIIRQPMVDYYLELAYALGCPQESKRLELATSAADERAADLVWSKLRLHGRPTMAFNSSGAFGAAKLWPPEYFAELALRAVNESDHNVLVLCGPSEREIAQDIVGRTNHPRVVSLAEESLSVGLSKACIRRSRMLVTTDSGPRHFAVAFGVPVIGLYGPTPPIWGDNPTARGVDLQVNLDCLGCHQRSCPLGHHRCMHNLTVDRVYEAIAAQLDETRYLNAA